MVCVLKMRHEISGHYTRTNMSGNPTIRPLTNWQGSAVAIAVRKGGHYHGGELVSGGGGWEGADAANAALEKLKE